MSAISGNTVKPANLQSYRHLWIVTGPAGCGKSTVARSLSKSLGLLYLEGDEFHTDANIRKMASGIPLADEDRWDWLILLRQQSLARLAEDVSGVILTCSALKRKYRDVIRIANYFNTHVLVRFIYLRASQELLLDRVKARHGHYMKDDMVQSQFESLEEPQGDEMDCLVVDVNGSQSEVEAIVLESVKRVLAQTVKDHTTD